MVLTDIGPVLPWLRRNVRENLTDKELQRVRVEQHAWYEVALAANSCSCNARYNAD